MNTYDWAAIGQRMIICGLLGSITANLFIISDRLLQIQLLLQHH